jgi:hypothetical protein
MTQMALDAFASGIDKPEVTLRVRFVDLGDTEEYAQFKGLITANMDDDVIIEHLDLGIEIKARVVYIEWDGLRNRANEIVLGNVMPNYANTAVAKDIDISALKNNMNTTLRENEIYNGMHVNHSDGFMTIAEIDGHTIRTKQNSQTGFAVYDGATFIGGVQVVNGKVLLKGNAVETSAVIGGKTITVKVDPSEGLAIYDGSTYVGGVAVVNGEVSMIGNKVMNSINGACYAAIGSVVDGGITYDGVSIYRKVGGSFNVIGRVLVSESGLMRIRNELGAQVFLGENGALILSTTDGISYWVSTNSVSIRYAGMSRFSCGATSLILSNASGIPLFYNDTSNTEVRSNNGNVYVRLSNERASITLSSVMRADITPTWSRLYSPNGNYAIGVDDSGVYKLNGATRIPL